MKGKDFKEMTMYNYDKKLFSIKDVLWTMREVLIILISLTQETKSAIPQILCLIVLNSLG